MKYKTTRGLVAALRKLETTTPKHPIKGAGHKREPLYADTGNALAALFGRESAADCQHITTVFARRSQTAKYNRMQFGGDEDFASPEMAKILAANEGLVQELVKAYRGHLAWVEDSKA